MAVKRKRKTAHQVVARRRVVRRLLVEGMADGEIVRALVIGLPIEGRVVKVSEKTARDDLAAVSDEFRDLFDCDDAVEREIGAAWERYKLIAKNAQLGKRPNYHAAIAALDRVVKIAASRSTRWRHLAGSAASKATTELPGLVPETDAELLARAQELAGLEPDDLREQHRQLRDRVEALGLARGPAGEA